MFFVNGFSMVFVVFEGVGVVGLSCVLPDPAHELAGGQTTTTSKQNPSATKSQETHTLTTVLKIAKSLENPFTGMLFYGIIIMIK